MNVEFCEHDWPGTGCKECREEREAAARTIVDQETIDRVAAAIDSANVDHSMSLVRLVDGVSTYRLEIDGSVEEFTDGEIEQAIDQAYARIRQVKQRKQAEAVIAALNPSPKTNPDGEHGEHRDGMDAIPDHIRRGSLITSNEAIKAVREGHRIARAGWNGKGMFVYRHEAAGFKPVLVLHTARGEHQPGWVFSQDDMFSDDWEIVP